MTKNQEINEMAKIEIDLNRIIGRLKKLHRAHEKANRWGDAGTVAYYMRLLNEIKSCDGGECGLFSYFEDRLLEIGCLSTV
jgi:hypothetical protein